jgi:hypothetical protein
MAESWNSIETFYILTLRLEMFLNEKGNAVAVLNNENLVWHCYMIVTFMEMTSNKLQGQQQLISDFFPPFSFLSSAL